MVKENTPENLPEEFGQEDEDSYEYDDDGETATEQTINQIIKNQQALDEKVNNFSTPGVSGRDSNFLHVQISTDDLLKKLENYYRGRVEWTDTVGNRGWKEPDNKELVLFNDYGVSSMMEIISRYIDKNTVLSSYREDRIYEILSDLGYELILFALCNYEKMGLDTHEKKTKFRLIIVTTCNIIESAYRRALAGATLNKLNESKAIHQFETNEQGQRVPIKKEGFFSKYFR